MNYPSLGFSDFYWHIWHILSISPTVGQSLASDVLMELPLTGQCYQKTIRMQVRVIPVQAVSAFVKGLHHEKMSISKRSARDAVDNKHKVCICVYSI